MKVESIAESILQYGFCNTFGLHLAIIGLEKTIFCLFVSGRLTQILQ